LAVLLILNGAALADVKFEVRLAAGNAPQPATGGRVLLAVAPANGQPSFSSVDPPAWPIIGADVAAFRADTVVRLDAKSTSFPLGKTLNDLPIGEYTVQAVFCHNPDLNLWNAPGHRYCAVQKVKIDPKADTPITLTLDKVFTDDLPNATATHKYHKLTSKQLSAFHGRPMANRIGVVLPRDYEKDPDKKYGLVVHIGGYGDRYTSAGRIRPDPRFVQIILDGAGPYGDPYQVNSANQGPYGDALTQEVIPFVEKEYRCLGTAESRFTTGVSTGGWVSLALLVYYPDFFNGCWSQAPDAVDFRAYELINIYQDTNAYVNRFGFERPAKRNINGDVVYPVRHEVQMERVRGMGDRWELSGEQWGSWNAVYGPKGADGKPVPLWDGVTGAIDRTAAKHWEKYDLRLILEKNWKALGPKLAGKIHIWVGDADDYFLNNGVHLLKQSLEKQTEPKFDGVIEIELRKPHAAGWSMRKILDEMATRAGLK
jgi:S-formylglutathione hydrolase FrmB